MGNKIKKQKEKQKLKRAIRDEENRRHNNITTRFSHDLYLNNFDNINYDRTDNHNDFENDDFYILSEIYSQQNFTHL